MFYFNNIILVESNKSSNEMSARVSINSVFVIRWLIFVHRNFKNQLCTLNLPKHMPQRPWRIVNTITQPSCPWHSTSKTASMKMSTNAVCPHITTNCVITWEKRTSAGVTPATQLLSKRPSILSMIKTEEVRATAKKKTILQEKYFDDDLDGKINNVVYWFLLTLKLLLVLRNRWNWAL